MKRQDKNKTKITLPELVLAGLVVILILTLIDVIR
jgi:hypothetical protein